MELFFFAFCLFTIKLTESVAAIYFFKFYFINSGWILTRQGEL